MTNNMSLKQLIELLESPEFMNSYNPQGLSYAVPAIYLYGSEASHLVLLYDSMAFEGKVNVQVNCGLLINEEGRCIKSIDLTGMPVKYQQSLNRVFNYPTKTYQPDTGQIVQAYDRLKEYVTIHGFTRGNTDLDSEKRELLNYYLYYEHHDLIKAVLSINPEFYQWLLPTEEEGV